MLPVYRSYRPNKWTLRHSTYEKAKAIRVLVNQVNGIGFNVVKGAAQGLTQDEYANTFAIHLNGAAK